jgi:hypothetical protein
MPAGNDQVHRHHCHRAPEPFRARPTSPTRADAGSSATSAGRNVAGRLVKTLARVRSPGVTVTWTVRRSGAHGAGRHFLESRSARPDGQSPDLRRGNKWPHGPLGTPGGAPLTGASFFAAARADARPWAPALPSTLPSTLPCRIPRGDRLKGRCENRLFPGLTLFVPFAHAAPPVDGNLEHHRLRPGAEQLGPATAAITTSRISTARPGRRRSTTIPGSCPPPARAKRTGRTGRFLIRRVRPVDPPADRPRTEGRSVMSTGTTIRSADGGIPNRRTTSRMARESASNSSTNSASISTAMARPTPASRSKRTS